MNFIHLVSHLQYVVFIKMLFLVWVLGLVWCSSWVLWCGILCWCGDVCCAVLWCVGGVGVGINVMLCGVLVCF